MAELKKEEVESPVAILWQGGLTWGGSTLSYFILIYIYSSAV